MDENNEHELPDLSVKQKQLYRSIKKKMKRYHSDDSEDEEEVAAMPNKLLAEKQKRKSHHVGNKHASKSVRKIEIGWTHNEVQVRKINGGGTRKISIPNDSSMNVILQEGKNLFFPNGKTIKGLKAEDCTFELYDFSHTQIKETETDTLGKIHDRVKPSGILRFYVCTTGPKLPLSTDKKVNDLQSSGDEKNSSKPEKIAKINSELMTGQSSSSSERSEVIAVLSSYEKDGATYLVLDATDSDAEPLPRYKDESNTSLSATLPLDDDTAHTRVDDLNLVSENSINLNPPRSPTPPPPVEGTERNIRIHRVKIEQEMIANFIDPNIMNDKLKFQLVDEKGVDANGLSREAYASFWAEFIETSTKGECERIPCIKPHMQKAEWKAVGRILCKGFVDQGIYPLKLSKAFSIALIHGEDAVTSDILLSSFMDYIAPMEKDVVDKALNNQLQDEEDNEEFLDLLDRMGCKSIPKADEVKPVILNIARKELIQSPKYALDEMMSTSRNYLALTLPSIQSVNDMYTDKMVTNRKIMKLLQPQVSGIDEDKCLGYLKQFIRGLDELTLKRFLRHVTGADMICVDKIEVHFNKRHGIGRVPVVRTCTPMIELSTSYASYTDFRAEFLNILAVHHPLDID